MTVTTRLLNTLRTGEELTARQIAARFSVASPHAVVHELRSQGYAIYLNRRVDTKGRVTQKYRLGTPTRAMVAVAFAAAGAELMNMATAA